MSKVNDALKRIRDTQQGAPRPSDAPALRLPTLAPAPAPSRQLGLIVPIVFAVVALLGLVSLILLWQLRQKQTGPVATVTPTPAPAPMEIASVVAPKPVLRPPAASKAGASTLIATSPPPAVAAPQAAVIKLQGILYTGRNSSAVISGQTVVAGDEIGGYRVAAIGESSVTLVIGAQTNVLSLGR